MLRENKKFIYSICFLIGFLSCWWIFNIHALASFYEKFLNLLQYNGIFYFIIYLFSAIFLNLFRHTLIKFSNKNNAKKINLIVILIAVIEFSLIYIFTNKFVKDWKTFTIHSLNYLLYIFAWYSLLKAIKVWYTYGNFFQLLIDGKICKYLKNTLFVLIVTSIVLFSLNIVSAVSSVGMLLISMIILSICCYIFTKIALSSQYFLDIFKQWNNESKKRINAKEQPKEVSIAYDQISAIGISGVISKRIFDISKDVDTNFVLSKLFKMVCYLISLSTTCKFNGQLNKLKKSLSFFICFIVFLLVLAYTPAFHEFLVKNPHISNIANKFIDFVILPLGISKVLVQIFTIIFAKKSTGISISYFLIGGFFTLITSCNLITKGNFTDTTITMSLFKGSLYFSVIFIAIFISKINKLIK